jgi:hypothetical protein
VGPTTDVVSVLQGPGCRDPKWTLTLGSDPEPPIGPAVSNQQLDLKLLIPEVLQTYPQAFWECKKIRKNFNSISDMVGATKQALTIYVYLVSFYSMCMNLFLHS